MNYTFTNSSIVSVNSGTIVLNVSGKTRTFVDAKLVSAVDGNIVLDLPSFELTEGAYVTIHLTHDPRIQRTFISNTDNDFWVTYHVTQCEKGIKFTGTWGGDCILRNATPEEIQELYDQLAAEGKRWNPDTMQIEKLGWKPKKGERYFYIRFGAGFNNIGSIMSIDNAMDIQLYESGNCFRTEKQAEAKLEQIKQLLKNDNL